MIVYCSYMYQNMCRYMQVLYVCLYAYIFSEKMGSVPSLFNVRNANMKENCSFTISANNSNRTQIIIKKIQSSSLSFAFPPLIISIIIPCVPCGGLLIERFGPLPPSRLCLCHSPAVFRWMLAAEEAKQEESGWGGIKFEEKIMRCIMLYWLSNTGFCMMI